MIQLKVILSNKLNYNNSDKSKTELESVTDDFITANGYRTSRTGLTVELNLSKQMIFL